MTKAQYIQSRKHLTTLSANHNTIWCKTTFKVHADMHSQSDEPIHSQQFEKGEEGNRNFAILF